MALLLAWAMLTSMLPVFAVGTGYSDTDGHWAQTEIDRWSSYGIWQGDGTAFYPDEPVTRAEAAAVFSRLMGYTKTQENLFTDLENKWYTIDVLKVCAAGLLRADDQAVRPEEPLNRQEGAFIR